MNDVPNQNYNQISATNVIVALQDYIRVQEDHICILKLFPISGNGVFIYKLVGTGSIGNCVCMSIIMMVECTCKTHIITVTNTITITVTKINCVLRQKL